MSKQARLLLILAVILASTTYYAIDQTPRLEKAKHPNHRVTATPKTGKQSSTTADATTDGVRLDLLKPSSQTFPGAQKDLFGPLFVVKAPPPSAVPKRIIKPPPPPPPPPPPLPPRNRPAVTVNPLPHFQFLGYLDNRDKKTVFLGQGEDVFVAKLGEHFGLNGEYLLTNLTDTQIRIQKEGESRPIMVAINDEKSQMPPGLR